MFYLSIRSFVLLSRGSAEGGARRVCYNAQEPLPFPLRMPFHARIA